MLGLGRRRAGIGTADDGAGMSRATEEVLFRAYRSSREGFARDAATRRGEGRGALRRETGLTDEVIEGWAVMLGREPGREMRLERRIALGDGGGGGRVGDRSEGEADGGTGEETEEGEGDGRGSGVTRGGRGRGRGRGRGGGNANASAGPTDERARRRKEANKSSRANHNRRDQRARKMARGGFAG